MEILQVLAQFDCVEYFIRSSTVQLELNEVLPWKGEGVEKELLDNGLGELRTAFECA